MSEKQKKVCGALNYFEHFLVFVCYGCVSISAFASLVSVPVGIPSSVVGISICAKLLELKSISQLSRKRGKPMTKLCR